MPGPIYKTGRYDITYSRTNGMAASLIFPNTLRDACLNDAYNRISNGIQTKINNYVSSSMVLDGNYNVNVEVKARANVTGANARFLGGEPPSSIEIKSFAAITQYSQIRL